MASIDKDKRALDIADYLFANPDKGRKDVVSIYSEKFNVSARTIDRLLEIAHKYNEERVRIAREKKNELFLQNEIESAKQDIITRNEAIELLSKMGRGIPQEISIETDSEGNIKTKFIHIPPADQRGAILQLATMNNWNIQAETTVGVKVDISTVPEEAKTFLLTTARKAIK